MNMRISDYLFQLIADGVSTQVLEEEFARNPKKNMYSIKDTEHIINAPSISGRTPLNVATSNGHLHLVKYLIEKGADPHIRSQMTASKTESNLGTVV